MCVVIEREQEEAKALLELATHHVCKPFATFSMDIQQPVSELL